MDENISQQNSQAQESGFVDKITGLFGTKKKLICAILLVFIFFLLTVLFSLNKNFKGSQTPQVTPTENPINSSKIWEIIFSYDTDKKILVVKSVATKSGTATASNLGLSPYKLLILDKNEKILFQTDVVISEGIVYSVLLDPKASGSAAEKATSAETVVDVPYFQNAAKIRVTKNYRSILEFSPPKSLSFELTPRVFAAESSLCMTNLNVVFLSEGYTSETQFESDVDKIKGFLPAKSPYNSKSEIFDFSRRIFNTVPLGCRQGGNLNVDCISDSNSESNIMSLTVNKYPELASIKTNFYRLKYLVLVNGGPQPFQGGHILGGMNAVGGQFGAFTTLVDDLTFERIVSHEFLGHAVGLLRDRYIYPDGTQNSLLTDVTPRSNCTSNRQGEAFWKNIAGTQVSKGCTSWNLYASSPQDCVFDPGINNFIGGSSKTIMSATNCGNPVGFDDVEKYWIENNILPNYNACQNNPTSTPTPSPSSTPTPTVPADESPTPSIVGPTPGSGGCVVINDSVTSSKYTYVPSGAGDTYNPTGDYTDWCRDGQWRCQTEASTYRVRNWCAPQTSCSTLPGGSPSVCVECNGNETLYNTQTYCRRFSGDCSNDPTKCTDLKAEWVENSLASGCHICQEPLSPSPTPVQYNCVPNPKCGQSEKTLQMCGLVCTQK